MGKIAEVWHNKWFRFALASILYILLFVVWTGNPWMLLGLLLIYDIYISKYIYRFVGRPHRELKQRNRTYKKTMEWVEAILYAVIVTTFIRFFWFAMYVIPTPSMEKTLLVGDFLYVSKLSYGPSVPNTPISFPLVHNTMPLSTTKRSYSESLKWPYHRLRGFGNVQRGDVVVFNFPAGDTVVLERQDETYYDILRAYQHQFGQVEGRRELFSDYTIITRPVDKRENYVKRCVALPGDSLEIVRSEVLINGVSLPEIPRKEFMYTVYTNGTPISQTAIEQMGLAKREVLYSPQAKVYSLPLTEQNLQRVSGMSNVLSVEKYEETQPDPRIFPQDVERYGWNADNFGPLWIPRRGATVPLNEDNLPLYRSIITNYEHHSLEQRGGVIYIDGQPASSYTFAMDYYFMMGDNRHNSLDSRFWGFVPEDHIVGKASFVWLSLDEDKKFPANIRWSRMFRRIR